MSISYEEIEKLELTLQVLRTDLFKIRKGEDINSTALIREMGDRDFGW